MIINIPNKQNKVWTQENNGDYNGVLKHSIGIDLSEPGKLKATPTLFEPNVLSSLVSNGVFVAIVYADPLATKKAGYWIFDKLSIFYSEDLTLSVPVISNPVQISLISTDIISDAIAWKDGLACATADRVYTLNRANTTWTDTGLPGAEARSENSTNGQATRQSRPVLCEMFNGSLLVGSGQRIHLRTSADAPVNIPNVVAKLSNQYQIKWIESGSNSVYIGTENLAGGNAKVYEWDGGSATLQTAYTVTSSSVLAGKMFEGILHVVTQDGRLLRFNGSGFDNVAFFPGYVKGKKSFATPLTTNTLQTVHGKWFNIYIEKNAMIVKDNSIYIGAKTEPQYSQNVDLGGASNTALDVMGIEKKCGIFEYNKNYGLVNKYSHIKDYASISCLCEAIEPSNVELIGAVVYRDPILGGIIPQPTARIFSTLNIGEVFSEVKFGYQRFSTARIEATSRTENWQDVTVFFPESDKDNDAPKKIADVYYKTKERLYDTFLMTVIGRTTPYPAEYTFKYVHGVSSKKFEVGSEVIRTTIFGTTYAKILKVYTDVAHAGYTLYDVGTTLGLVINHSINPLYPNDYGEYLTITNFIHAGEINSGDLEAGYKVFQINKSSAWLEIAIVLRTGQVIDNLQITSNTNI